MNVEKVLGNHGGLDDFATIFNEEIEKFLMLLKLLPIRNQGRSAASKRLNFNETIDKLLIYNKVFVVLSTKFRYQLERFNRILIFDVFSVWKAIDRSIEIGKSTSIHCHDWANSKKNHTILYRTGWKVHKCNSDFC